MRNPIFANWKYSDSVCDLNIFFNLARLFRRGKRSISIWRGYAEQDATAVRAKTRDSLRACISCAENRKSAERLITATQYNPLCSGRTRKLATAKNLRGRRNDQQPPWSCISSASSVSFCRERINVTVESADRNTSAILSLDAALLYALQLFRLQRWYIKVDESGRLHLLFAMNASDCDKSWYSWLCVSPYFPTLLTKIIILTCVSLDCCRLESSLVEWVLLVLFDIYIESENYTLHSFSND